MHYVIYINNKMGKGNKIVFNNNGYPYETGNNKVVIKKYCREG